MPGRRAEHSASSLEVRYNNNPNSRFFSRVADAYRKEGDIARAIDICMKGLEAYPDYITGRIILGRCYLEQEKIDGAVQEFTRVCENDRKNHVAIKMLADIFARQGFENKAGDLYSMLLKMDPSNVSIKQLCSQYKPSGSIDLFEILGISAPQLQEEQQFTSESLEVGDQDLQPVISYNENEIPETMSPESHDLNFTEELDTIDTDQVQEISSEDISDRMAMMFGEKGDSIEGNTQQAPENEIELTESQIDQPENLELPSLAESSSVTELNEDVSGLDISSRIDELFGDEKNKTPEPDTGKSIDLDISLPDMSAHEQPSDNGKQSVEENPFADLALEELSQNILDNSPLPESPEQPSFSAGNDFGETVKIDRSILEEIHKDAQEKESIASGESLIEELKADVGKIELIADSDNTTFDLVEDSVSIISENESNDGQELIAEDNSQIINISELQPENEEKAPEELISETNVFAQDPSGEHPDSSDIDLITIEDSHLDENTGAGLSKDNSVHEEFVSDMDVLIEIDESERDSGEIELVSEDTVSVTKVSQPEAFTSEKSEEHVSEMDVLAEEIPGSVQLSGDDVVKKLDLLFSEPADNSEKKSSDSSSQLDSSSEITENEPGILENNQVLDQIEHLEIVEPENQDDAESLIDHLEEPTLEINTSDLEEEQISLSDADLAETMEMQDEDEHQVLAEEQLDVNGQADTSFLDESIDEIIDSGTLISPSDIENRLKDLFPDNISSSAGMIPEDDEEQQDNTAGEYYTVSGESVTDNVTFEDLDDFGNVEIDSPVEIDSSSSEPEARFSEIDDRDKPYSIPDHVITPTLADLYFQQGQPQLAIQIYERLLKLDPDNDKFKNRILQIRKAIDDGSNSILADLQDEKPEFNIPKVKKHAARASGKKKPIDNRPLAGVRIKKNKKK
jgi:pilus assembly protein FimV